MKTSRNKTLSLQFSVDLSRAVYMLAYIENHSNDEINSVVLAEKIGISSVQVRQYMAVLSRAGFIESRIGPGGVRLLKSVEDITLLDITKALDINMDDLIKTFIPVNHEMEEVMDFMKQDFINISDVLKGQLQIRTIGDYCKEKTMEKDDITMEEEERF